MSTFHCSAAYRRKYSRREAHACRITGTVCGVRVQEVEEETMRLIRILDKLVDELAKGKALEKVLRQA